MLEIKVYEIYSCEYPYTGEEKVHGVRVKWNVPGTDKGAMQLRDRILNDFYRKGIEVYVCAREKKAIIDEKHLVFL